MKSVAVQELSHKQILIIMKKNTNPNEQIILLWTRG